VVRTYGAFWQRRTHHHRPRHISGLAGILRVMIDQGPGRDFRSPGITRRWPRARGSVKPKSLRHRRDTVTLLVTRHIRIGHIRRLAVHTARGSGPMLLSRTVRLDSATVRAGAVPSGPKLRPCAQRGGGSSALLLWEARDEHNRVCLNRPGCGRLSVGTWFHRGSAPKRTRA
jgi:hypothetical protein